MAPAFNSAAVHTAGALRLRRRSLWEAADAGLLLWRRDFFYFLPFFALPFWICAFALRLRPEFIRPWSLFILWFLKPLFDRPMLHVIGVRFFEPRSASGRLLRGLGKDILQGLPGDLLWRRFSPWRAVMMPVRVLEGLKPAQARQRKQSLSNGGIDFCVLITIWGLLLEVMLLGGETLFLLMAVELMQKNYITSIFDFLAGKGLFFFTAYCVNYMLIESLYVCMGFGLYINSRVELEGWDLEVLFRSFLKKVPRPAGKRSAKKSTSVAGALAVCLLLLLFVPANAYAETGVADSAAGSVQSADAVPFGALEDILGSGDFGGEKEVWGIRFRRQKEYKPLPAFNTLPWVELIKRIFAVSLRVVLVLAILALAVFSFIYVFRLKNRGGGPFNKPPHAGALPTGPADESPEQLLAEARSLCARGRLREAWAACFSAALAGWSSYRQLSFPVDATEYGCLALVRAASVSPAATGPAAAVPPAKAAEVSAFGDLIFAWVAFAYGGIFPPEGAFEKALAFCESLRAPNG
ncbi:hypothetical protein AGMMS50268_32700 [Spirochaetia bacterium]|nr:hypothetical protein AGMMS50268_32700 [Spirochaetia bacterium]